MTHHCPFRLVLISFVLPPAPMVWKKRDGEEPITFSSWAPNEPNDHGNGEACGGYWNHARLLNWNDFGCGMRANYICEYKGKLTKRALDNYPSIRLSVFLDQ